MAGRSQASDRAHVVSLADEEKVTEVLACLFWGSGRR